MIFLLLFFLVTYSNGTEKHCNLLTTKQNCLLDSSCSWNYDECNEIDNCVLLKSQESCLSQVTCAFYHEQCSQFLSCSSYLGTQEICENIFHLCTSVDEETCIDRNSLSTCNLETEDCFKRKNSINLLVIGKTGVGKSMFLNLLLQEVEPKKGKFHVFHQTQSQIQKCQITRNSFVEYRENQQLHFNIIDTPGLFDTKDRASANYYNETLPSSILHLRDISNNLNNPQFQKQLNRILIVISADQKFDVQVQGLLEISQILNGKNIKPCVIITKCQKLYDRSQDNSTEIIELLTKFIMEWRVNLEPYGVNEIFFFNDWSMNQVKEKNDKEAVFYYTQWRKLIEILENSYKAAINVWDDLSTKEKNQIGHYFNYHIGKSYEQLDSENNILQDYILQLQKEKEQLMLSQKQMNYQFKQDVQKFEAQISNPIEEKGKNLEDKEQLLFSWKQKEKQYKEEIAKLLNEKKMGCEEKSQKQNKEQKKQSSPEGIFEFLFKLLIAPFQIIFQMF